MLVKACRVGLILGRTDSGYVDAGRIPYVALPCKAALGQWVRVTNMMDIDPETGTGRELRAPVLQVGPWFDYDFDYVFGGSRPLVELAPDRFVRPNDRSAIALSSAAWDALHMREGGEVNWTFLILDR